MTMIHEVVCDGCGHGAGISEESQEKASALALSQGWVRTVLDDFCRDCAEERELLPTPSSPAFVINLDELDRNIDSYWDRQRG